MHCRTWKWHVSILSVAIQVRVEEWLDHQWLHFSCVHWTRNCSRFTLREEISNRSNVWWNIDTANTIDIERERFARRRVFLSTWIFSKLQSDGCSASGECIAWGDSPRDGRWDFHWCAKSVDWIDSRVGMFRQNDRLWVRLVGHRPRVEREERLPRHSGRATKLCIRELKCR